MRWELMRWEVMRGSWWLPRTLWEVKCWILSMKLCSWPCALRVTWSSCWKADVANLVPVSMTPSTETGLSAQIYSQHWGEQRVHAFPAIICWNLIYTSLAKMPVRCNGFSRYLCHHFFNSQPFTSSYSRSSQAPHITKIPKKSACS
jgi:hypothetical protein